MTYPYKRWEYLTPQVLKLLLNASQNLVSKIIEQSLDYWFKPGGSCSCELSVTRRSPGWGNAYLGAQLSLLPGQQQCAQK